MADILSQEELDALLGQMKAGDDDEDEGEEDDFFSAAANEVMDDDDVPESMAEADAEDAEDLEWGDEDADESINVQMILNLPIKTNVELGRARMSIGELVDLGQGAVIELDHLATDLIQLTIHDKIIAQGEAVVVNENFGFRVIEVESIRNRIKKL